MNIHFGNQSQFELFPGTTGDPIENSAPRFIFSRIVLSFENVVVIFVFIVVSLIIAFSFGVERGRAKMRVTRPAAQMAVVTQTANSVMPSSKIPTLTAIKAISQPQADTSRTVAEVVDFPSPPVAVKLINPVIVATVPKGALAEKGVDKSYTIQVASYKIEAQAKREAASLNQIVPGHLVARVRIARLEIQPDRIRIAFLLRHDVGATNDIE